MIHVCRFYNGQRATHQVHFDIVSVLLARLPHILCGRSDNSTCGGIYVATLPDIRLTEIEGDPIGSIHSRAARGALWNKSPFCSPLSSRVAACLREGRVVSATWCIARSSAAMPARRASCRKQRAMRRIVVFLKCRKCARTSVRRRKFSRKSVVVFGWRVSTEPALRTLTSTASAHGISYQVW